MTDGHEVYGRDSNDCLDVIILTEAAPAVVSSQT